MRALSLRAAANCEYALTPRCHCRCGGKLHGAKRLGDAWGEVYAPPRERFEMLPADDPHHLPTADEIRAARAASAERRRERRARRRGLIKRLNEASRNASRWRAWKGDADAPLPPYLVREFETVQAELAKE